MADGVHILPARFDDSELPGLLPDVTVVDLRRYTPSQFADLIMVKLADLAVVAPTSPTPPESSRKLNARPVKLFISYSHQDERHKEGYSDRPVEVQADDC